MLSPVINESFLQSLLKKLLDDPGRLVQPALQRILDFVLTHGGKGNVENSLGLTPMRMVMQWSERAPVLAEKTWKALMQAQGDIEESHLPIRVRYWNRASQKTSGKVSSCSVNWVRAEKLLPIPY